MKKQLITGMIAFCMIASFSSVSKINKVSASEFNSSDIQQLVEEGHLTEQTKEEKEASDEKLKLAEEYVKEKEKQKGYNQKKVLSGYRTAVQKNAAWCGPAAAYNATNGRLDQSTFAMYLGTSDTNGTNFPGTWAKTFKRIYPQNNYMATKGSGYSSSSWRNKLKSSIITTIDRGYPVIADCKITNNSNRIHPSYSYATNTLHYVGVLGYDDLPNTVPAKVFIVDSNSRIPDRTYWTSLDKLSAATNPLGIVW